MSYSVANDTKIATYNGVEYSPNQSTNAQTQVTTLTALTEDECKAQIVLAEEKPARDLERLRFKRDNLLKKSDWMANSDVTMTDAWKTYRQALRDITKTFKSMSDKDFKFPTKPTE
tara:strand:+ start:1513 stop:1860 length:348 start_codon:yes stop_codon:yes gene_type:complete